MKLTTVLRACLLGLATTADARVNLLPDLNALTPVVGRRRQVVQAHKQQGAQVQAVVPSAVVFHETNVTTNVTDGNNNGTLTVLTNTTSTGESKPSNVNACTAPTYTDVSPLRTKTIRHHCEHLADKVLARAGYWEMDQWASLPAGGGAYLGLATEETCQFGIALILNEKLVHEQGSVFGHNASMVSAAATMTNATINEVAIIGNQDVYSILYAAVHDNAWIMDEEYMDQTTTQGLVYCQFQHTANVTLGFKLQYVGEDDDDDSN